MAEVVEEGRAPRLLGEYVMVAEEGILGTGSSGVKRGVDIGAGERRREMLGAPLDADMVDEGVGGCMSGGLETRLSRNEMGGAGWRMLVVLGCSRRSSSRRKRKSRPYS